MIKSVIGLCLLLITSYFLLPTCCFAGIGQKSRQANRLYQKGEYDEALKKYRDAQIDAPENPVLHYNIGNALHQKKQYEKSAEEYEKSLAKEKDKTQRPNVFYNLGNTMYRSGKLPEAIKYYEKCLELNPGDKDAKYNLELTRKKIKQMMQNAQSRKQIQKQQKQRKSEEAKKQKGQEEKKERGVGEEKEKKKMSKEDAERLLKAAEEEAKKQKRRYAMPGGQRIIDKDW